MVCGTPTDSLGTTSYINAWYVRSFGDLGYDDYVVYGISYGRSSPFLDNANLENCWCVTAEYEEFYGYVGLGDLRHNSYGLLSTHGRFVTVMVCDYTHLASFIITTTSLVPTVNIPFVCILFV